MKLFPALLFVSLLILLASCGGTGGGVAAQALAQPGDLPAGVALAPADMPLPDRFGGIPPARETAFQPFVRGAQSAGGAAVFVYPDATGSAAAYDFLAAGSPNSDFGVCERATRAGPEVTLFASEILFVRCRAVVQVRLIDTDLEAATAYARALDGRLRAAVC
jgi:hypothetical protein